MPLVAGCEDDDPVVAADYPPFPPDGVFSVTGDGVVTISWNPNQESDLAGYRVYRGNEDLSGPYFELATVPADQTFYDDFDVNNGETWFYAVAAFDARGNESDLNAEDVYDTPRPEGFDLVLVELGQEDPPVDRFAGYDFSSLSNESQPASVSTTDIYFDAVNGVNYVRTTAGVDIQDYGLIDLVAVDYAPENGWAPSGMAEAIQNHCYIVRILDGSIYHYAKFEVKTVTSASVKIDWAYQPSNDLEFGNRELSVGGGVR